MKQGTYEVRHGHVIRTEFSLGRAEIRKVWRSQDMRDWQEAQERVDEKKLSRSKPYAEFGQHYGERERNRRTQHR